MNLDKSFELDEHKQAVSRHVNDSHSIIGIKHLALVLNIISISITILLLFYPQSDELNYSVNIIAIVLQVIASGIWAWEWHQVNQKLGKVLAA